jgi:hypothetical protein
MLSPRIHCKPSPSLKGGTCKSTQACRDLLTPCIFSCCLALNLNFTSESSFSFPLTTSPLALFFSRSLTSAAFRAFDFAILSREACRASRDHCSLTRMPNHDPHTPSRGAHWHCPGIQVNGPPPALQLASERLPRRTRTARCTGTCQWAACDHWQPVRHSRPPTLVFLAAATESTSRRRLRHPARICSPPPAA